MKCWLLSDLLSVFLQVASNENLSQPAQTKIKNPTKPSQDIAPMHAVRVASRWLADWLPDPFSPRGVTIHSHFIFPPSSKWIFYFLTSLRECTHSSHNPPLMSHNTSSKSPLEPTWFAPSDVQKINKEAGYTLQNSPEYITISIFLTS